MVHRRRKARRQGCWVEPTRGGLLRFRFRWRLPGDSDLRKFSETTELRDTPENRTLLDKQAAIIGAEIRAGTFDHARCSPSGKGAALVQSRMPSARPKRASEVTVAQYYQAWIGRKLPPLVRPSRARDYRNHFRPTFFHRWPTLSSPSSHSNTWRT